MTDLDKTLSLPPNEDIEEPQEFLKAKPKRFVSEERRKALSEQMKRVNTERIEKARIAKSGEYDIKEKKKMDELERIRERKLLSEQSSIRDAVKAQSKTKEIVDKLKNKNLPAKKEKKAPIIVYESESESDQYDNQSDGSESSQEVIYVKKKPTASVKQLKPKKTKAIPPEPVVVSLPVVKPIIRFI